MKNQSNVFHDEKLGMDYKYDGTLGQGESSSEENENDNDKEKSNSSREFDPDILDLEDCLEVHAGDYEDNLPPMFDTRVV